MADLIIQQSDLIDTLEAQRNEAWNAAAKSGAACASLVRERDGLRKELETAKARIVELETVAQETAHKAEAE